MASPAPAPDRKSTRLNSSHVALSRMPSSACKKSNAVHAMPEGGTLRAELAVEHGKARRAAALGALASGEHVLLTVADTGSCIFFEIGEPTFDPSFSPKEVRTG